MGLTTTEAYALLELPTGTDADTIRTNYKRLAMKCFPSEKNNNSTVTKNRFCQLSEAFKRLAIDNRDSNRGKPLNLMEAKGIYEGVWASGVYTGKYNGYCSSNSSSSEDNDEEDNYNYTKSLHKGLKNVSSPSRNQRSVLTEEERNRNARELISDEEREKRIKDKKDNTQTDDLTKAEKKRLKKKRQKEKKRLEKEDDEEEEVQQNSKESSNTNQISSSNKTESINNTAKSKASTKKDKKKTATEEEIDPKAAFVSNAINKKKKSSLDQQTSKKDTKSDAKINGTTENDTDELDAVVLRSRRVAIRGNEMAQSGFYTQAIELFTEAIKLDPSDFRFFGNRSYCFDRIYNYDRALKDAEKAISLSVDWPKGYFRKGRALSGLLNYADAEQAFLHVLKLDKNCDDALQELQRVRVQQLIDMGFSTPQAEAGIRQYGTVQNALDSLLAGQENNTTSDGSVSEDDAATITASPLLSNKNFQPALINDRLTTTDQVKIDPSNPRGYRTLWVGNVLPEITEKKLGAIFGKYGNIVSVRCLPEKFCAFINYMTKEAAGKAMTTLQGVQCGTQRLLIKYPDNPIENGVVIRGGSVPKPPPQPKQSGPVKDGECYFWRTTGCQFGDKCHYVHDPTHKGVDKKPWQH